MIKLSRTLRVIMPTVSKLGANGINPSFGIKSLVGLRPTSPHAAAGCRAEPPVSEAVAAKQ